MNQDQIGLLAITAWEMTWKGIGMWKASQKKQLKWFIAIFVINSLGLLPIFYMYREKIMANFNLPFKIPAKYSPSKLFKRTK